MTALSGTLDPSLAFLGLDPFAPELPPETVDLEMPEGLMDDPGWVWAPVDCACTDHCSCEVLVRTFSSRWDAATAAAAEAQPPAAEELVHWAVPGLWGEPASPAPVTFVVGGLVERLQETLRLLETTVPAELPGPQALAETETLLEVSQRLRVHLLARLRDVDARKLHELREARSAGSWFNKTAADADPSDLRLARRLGDAPSLAAALDAGVLSLRGADLVQAALNKVRRYLDRADGLIDGQNGEVLVEAAVGNVLDLVCRQYLGLADDDPRVHALDQRLGAILARGGSQTARLEQAFVVLAEHLPLNALDAALDEIVHALLPNLLELAAQRSRARRAFRVTPSRPAGRSPASSASSAANGSSPRWPARSAATRPTRSTPPPGRTPGRRPNGRTGTSSRFSPSTTSSATLVPGTRPVSRPGQRDRGRGSSCCTTR